LLGCEYLGGCPAIGARVLNKVELHFDNQGLRVAVAPQGVFTLVAPRPVLSLAWSEITVLAATTTRARPSPLVPRLARSLLKVCTMRLDLADQLAVGTPMWTMTVGVRVGAAELTAALQELLASCGRPTPVVTTD
jgi:hypothetical protein